MSPGDFSTESPVIETRRQNILTERDGQARLSIQGVRFYPPAPCQRPRHPGEPPKPYRWHAISVYGFDIGGRTNSSEQHLYSVPRKRTALHPLDRYPHTALADQSASPRTPPGSWAQLRRACARSSSSGTWRQFRFDLARNTRRGTINTVCRPPSNPSLAPYRNTLNSRIAMPYVVEISRSARLAEITSGTLPPWLHYVSAL